MNIASVCRIIIKIDIERGSEGERSRVWDGEETNGDNITPAKVLPN